MRIVIETDSYREIENHADLDRQLHDTHKLNTAIKGLLEVGQVLIESMNGSPSSPSAKPDPQDLIQAFAAGYASAQGRPDVADLFYHELAYCAPEVLVEEAASRWPLFVTRWPAETAES